MRKKSSSFAEVGHLELRRLLSTVFVDAIAPGPTHNGSSWADAYTDLQQALSVATTGTTIEVGQGTYKPTASSSRSATFQLINGVSIDGGYEGYGQPNPDSENEKVFPTILSGDIGVLGDNSDNSYHVVIGSGTNSTATLYGFTITGGNSYSPTGSGGGILNLQGSPTIEDCTITGNNAPVGGGIEDAINSSPTMIGCTISGNTANQGAGIQNYTDCSPTLTDCIISGNTAANNGGGMYNYGGSSPSLTDCTISGNTAFDGAGISDKNASPTLTNCVISGNTGGGGLRNIDHSSPVLVDCTLSGNTTLGIYNYNNSHTTLTNSILWRDGSYGSGLPYPGPIEIYNADSTSSTTITFSDIDQSSITGSGDVDIDPEFTRDVGTAGANDFGDLHLQATSPVINIGSNAADTGITTDADGNSRIVGGIADMGAYEFQTAQPIYVDRSATGLGNGHTWADAFTSLQTALSAVTGGATIDVAQGIYKPTTSTDRTATFKLQTGLTLDGGFAGDTTSDPGQRDASRFVSTLSGDIGTLGNQSDNSYSVVTADATGAAASLDGFTITGGNADGGAGHNSGGGILNEPVGNDTAINDCLITGNFANNGGGVAFYYGSGTMTDCTITGNTSDNGGGVIVDGTDPTLTDCTITGNTATNAAGGLFNLYGSPTLINSIISGNTTSGNGGGIFNDVSSIAIINCTISGNTASLGGGLYALGSIGTPSSATLTNCILWGDIAPVYNEIGNGAHSTVTITYSDIDQTGLAGTGDIDADPMFVRNPGTNSTSDFGDLHLRGNSLAINTASDAAISGTTTDFAGNSRIIAGTVDMGAFESTATQLVIFTQPPINTAPGGSMSIVVDVDDQNGNIVATDNSKVVAHIATGPAGASLGGTFTVAAQNGIATFNALSLPVDGNYTLSFSDGSLTGATTNSFSIGMLAPTSMTIILQPADTTAGKTVPTIDVEVKDQFGNRIDGSDVSIALATSPSGASLGGTATLATSNGVASFSNLVLDQAGTYTLAFSDGSLPGITSSSFTVSPAAASKLVFITEPANAIAGQALSPAVEVEDPFGNPADGSIITLAIATGPLTATLGGALSLPTLNGLAAFSNVTLDRAGTFTISASDGNLPSITSSSLAITYAGPQLVFTDEPANAIAGAKLSAITVETVDPTGTLVTTGKSKISVAISSGGKLIGSANAAVKAGKVIFSKLSIQKAGIYTLTATDPSFASAISTTFTISAAATKKMIFDLQPGNITSGTPFNVSVALLDKYSNIVNDGSTVNLVLGSHPAGVTLNSSAIVTDGLTDFDHLTLDTAGNYTLMANDGKLKATSKKFAVT
jgi:parallel beta-helix repeat protein